MDSSSEIRVMTHAAAPQHEDVAILAFGLWQERGAPIGTPEIDWFLAEAKLKDTQEQGEPALSAVARIIGSALGSVAAIVTPDDGGAKS
jgi:Protein of unknown function (DUF2934)